MLHKTLETDYTKIFTECWKTDPSIYTTWHISPGSLEDCVNHSVEKLNKVKDEYGLFKLYSIKLNEIIIGFYGTEGKYLTTIFISPDYRKDYKQQVWQMIKDDLGENFVTGLYSKNIRAIKFMLKNGGIPMFAGKSEDKPFILIQFGEGI